MTTLVQEVCRFMSFLGYSELIFKTDGEPSVTLQQKVQEYRLKLGTRTVLQSSARGDHQSNGAIENAARTVRDQANICLKQLEDLAVVKVQTFDCLHGWAFLHAAWTHNRLHVVQGLTAIERSLGGSVCRGKVARFGECVLAYMKVRNKGNPSWVKGIWLGKVNNSDMRLVTTPGAGSKGGGLVFDTPNTKAFGERLLEQNLVAECHWSPLGLSWLSGRTSWLWATKETASSRTTSKCR